jgi:hypothetical protein
MPKRSSIIVKTWLHSLEETMQPLEQFMIIEATKQLFETSQQMHEDRTDSKLEPVTTRSNWRQRLAQALIKIAQLLEPDSQTPIRSRKAKQ